MCYSLSSTGPSQRGMTRTLFIITKAGDPRNREGGYNFMKISRLEFYTVLLTAAFLAFATGWFLRGNTAARPITVETERTLSAREAEPISLPTPSARAGGRVNINTASAQELETLPGIGPSLAAAIVAFRVANGPFRIPEDITGVKGIGEGALEELNDLITTGG